jgi:ATP-dependent DNA helicase RecG
VDLNQIDTQGGGIKRMFETQRRRSFPLPDYDLSSSERVQMSIPGRILDERYTRLLMQQPELSLSQVIQLDRVQKGLPISREEHQQLKNQKLVEGRFPNLIVSAALARVTGETARHIRESGLNKQYYLDLILELIRQHGPVTRKEVDALLLPKLPERLSEEQKRAKVHNLMQESPFVEPSFPDGSRVPSDANGRPAVGVEIPSRRDGAGPFRCLGAAGSPCQLQPRSWAAPAVAPGGGGGDR